MGNSREEKIRKLIKESVMPATSEERADRLREAMLGTGAPGFDHETLEAYVAGALPTVSREIVEMAMAEDDAIRQQVESMLEVKAELSLGRTPVARRVEPTHTRRQSGWIAWGGWSLAAVTSAIAVFAVIRSQAVEPPAPASGIGQMVAMQDLERTNEDLRGQIRQFESTLAEVNQQLDEARRLNLGTTRPDQATTRIRPPRTGTSATSGTPSVRSAPKVALQDGPTTIVETPSGLATLEAIPDPVAGVAIDGERIGPRQVERDRGAVRWPAGQAHPDVPTGSIDVELVDPCLTAVVETTPSFIFQPIPGAVRYSIRIFLGSKLVAEQSSDETQFTLEVALEPGQEYRWTLTGHSQDGREITIATAGDFAATFRVLSDGERERYLGALAEDSDSKLHRIRTSAKFGLAAEAERQAKALLADNPDSGLARSIVDKLVNQRSALRKK